MPNSEVGINPAQGVQTLKLTFIVTPDNAQQYIGTTQFDILKLSDTQYKR